MAKIAVDCGHGLYTSGKRCMKKLDPNETREWVLNDRVGDALITYLKSAGHTILRVDDSTGATDVSLANRVAKANKWGADYYISVHHNAGIAGGTGGGTIMYKYNGTSGKTKTTQEAIYKYAIARGKLKGDRSDGTLDGDFYVIRKTNMPAGLIECGFMDSKTDIGYVLDPSWSKEIALGIAEGICEVWGGTIKTETKNNSVSTTTSSSTSKAEKTIYRVRKTWADAKTQKGAYSNLENAKKCANQNVGYYVFDESGKVVYPVDSAVKTSTKKDLGKVNITMQGYTTKWWPAVKNDNDWVGQADGKPIKYLAVKVDKGSITGRVYTQNGGWLQPLTFGNSYNLKDLNKGVLGDGSPIQVIKLDYNTPDGYVEQQAYYCVSDINHKTFYPEQRDVVKGFGMDGYAGVIGVSIDKLKAHIE